MVVHTKAYTIFSPMLMLRSILVRFIPYKNSIFKAIDKTIKPNINDIALLFSEKEYLCLSNKPLFVMLKGLLFDMDGVLVNNLEIHRQAFAEFFRRYGVERSFDELNRHFGRGNDDIMGELMPREIVERVGIRELGNQKEAIYREIYAPIIEPQAGLVEFLSKSHGRGLLAAVGSSGFRANVDFVLDKCNIRKYFQAAVAGDEVTRCKPDPEIYLTAAAKLGLEPSECIVFEDAEAGIEAGKRAGMCVVALATTFDREFLEKSDADYIIDDFRGLEIETLEQLLNSLK